MKAIQIWQIIWENTLFHWLVLLVFVLAVSAELYGVAAYEWHKRHTQAALRFLRQWRGETVPPAPSGRIGEWMRSHLLLDPAGNPQQRGDYFILAQYPAFLTQSPRSSLRFVPSLCTAIGVLGTFYGIQSGLQGVNLGFDDSAELLGGIKQLLLGMNTAFSSSLMGLGLGSAFAVVLFVADTVRCRQRAILRGQIERLFVPRGTRGGAVSGELTPEAIADAVGVAIAREVAPTLEAIATALPTLSDRLHHCNTALDTLQNQGFAELRTASDTFQQTLAQFQGETTAVLTQTREGIQRGFAESRDSIAAQQTAFAESATSATQLLQSLREQLQAALRDRAAIEQQMLQQLHQRTLEIIEQSHRSFTQQSATLETVGEQASGLMRDAKTELIGGLQEINEVLLNSNQTVEGYFAEFSQTYQGSLQEFFSQSLSLMEAQRRAFRESAADAADTFAEVKDTLETALQTHAQLERELLDTLRTHFPPHPNPSP